MALLQVPASGATGEVQAAGGGWGCSAWGDTDTPRAKTKPTQGVWGASESGEFIKPVQEHQSGKH